MIFYACRRLTPMPKLLPSNETIQWECTSRETIFSNQVIAAGTSKNSSRRSIYLGKISSSLECWPEHGPYLQVSLSLSLSNIPPQQSINIIRAETSYESARGSAMWHFNFAFRFFFFF